MTAIFFLFSKLCAMGSYSMYNAFVLPPTSYTDNTKEVSDFFKGEKFISTHLLVPVNNKSETYSSEVKSTGISLTTIDVSRKYYEKDYLYNSNAWEGPKIGFNLSNIETDFVKQDYKYIRDIFSLYL